MSNGSYSYANATASNYYSYGSSDATPNVASSSTLRRRTGPAGSVGQPSAPSSGPPPSVVQRLDFMFPKVDSEFTYQTDRGGVASLIAYALIALLALAETVTWIGQNGALKEHISVDTSLGKRMRVDMNITFPALACVDLHVDAMDVAGDSQIDVEDTLVKRQLHLDGRPLSKTEIKAGANAHRQEQENKERILKQELPDDYCGPCFGAQDEEGQCCQTCDELLVAYKKKRWDSELLLYTSEQCIREGRDKKELKRMTKGQGCNLSGYMLVNRVAGNFHIAMGEGIERDGRHIHTFIPDDTPNFNASHIIHELTFGPVADDGSPLNGVQKIVGEEHGTTGLFQYFIKVVPTTYIGEESLPADVKNADELMIVGDDGTKKLETNRYFFTERFRPLMSEYLEEEHLDKDDPKKAGVHAGHGGGHSNTEHHKVQNSVLPGVFFIYEIYPFAVEVSTTRVPFTHLLIRLMATVGGVFTVMRWLDSCLFERDTSKKRRTGL